MDTAEEAADYDAMDHSEVNRVFVDDFLRAAENKDLAPRLRGTGDPLRVLDVGTGTALIPIELCRRGIACCITAVDLSREMLRLARRNVSAAGFEDRIFLEHVDAKWLPFEDGAFDAVISNSIIHHIPEPRTALAEMLRAVGPGGLLFVRDLLRPPDSAAVETLVRTYAGQENAHQQQMFRASLHAALTLGELCSLLAELRVPAEPARQTSDRHWTLEVCLAEPGAL